MDKCQILSSYVHFCHLGKRKSTRFDVKKHMRELLYLYTQVRGKGLSYGRGKRDKVTFMFSVVS